MHKQINIGDEVTFLNEKGGGTITQIISKHKVVVLIEHGIEIPYPISEIIIVKSIAKNNPPVKKEEQDKSTHLKTHAISFQNIDKQIVGVKKNKIILEKEVDLHIEELVESPNYLSNGEKLEIQLQRVNKELDNAVLNRTKKLILIHGVGSGRLKQEIWKILKSYPKISFREASYKKYGFGATQVDFY